MIVRKVGKWECRKVKDFLEVARVLGELPVVVPPGIRPGSGYRPLHVARKSKEAVRRIPDSIYQRIRYPVVHDLEKAPIATRPVDSRYGRGLLRLAVGADQRCNVDDWNTRAHATLPEGFG